MQPKQIQKVNKPACILSLILLYYNYLSLRIFKEKVIECHQAFQTEDLGFGSCNICLQANFSSTPGRMTLVHFFHGNHFEDTGKCKNPSKCQEVWPFCFENFRTQPFFWECIFNLCYTVQYSLTLFSI